MEKERGELVQPARDETRLTSTSIFDCNCNILYCTVLYFEYYTYFGVGVSAAVAAAVAHCERDAERDKQQHEQQDQQNLRVRAETRRAINARELLDSFGGDYDCSYVYCNIVVQQL